MSVLCVGLATLDVVQWVDHVPAANEKVVAGAARVEAGGPALNAAVTAAALGVPSVLVSGVGGGSLGELIRADLAAHRVTLLDAAPAGFRAPLSTVLITAATGERAVVSRNAEGAAVGEPPGLAEQVAAARAMLVDGHHLGFAVAAARLARARGIPVLLDGGSWKPGLEHLLPLVTHAVLSEDFTLPVGAPAQTLLTHPGCRVVARSRGDQPLQWWAADGGSGEIPVPTGPVVDTLGAGDVLHGAVLAGLHAGLRAPEALLGPAVALASRSAGYPGARGWIDGIDAIQ